MVDTMLLTPSEEREREPERARARENSLSSFKIRVVSGKLCLAKKVDAIRRGVIQTID